MSDPVKKLQLALRAETTLLKLEVRRALRSAGLSALAGVLLLFGFAFLNFAAYEALTGWLGPALAALAVAAGDIALGVLLLGFARAEPDRSEEESLARELRELTYGSLGEDLTTLHGELRDFAADVRRLRAGLGAAFGVIGGPLSALAGLFGSLVEGAERRAPPPPDERA
jgi:hypothetical protein